MNFLAGLILGPVDDAIHSAMTRYGRGTFEGPGADASVKGKKLTASGSYLYVPILGQTLASISDDEIAVRGLIVTKTDITEVLEDHGLDVLDIKKRGGYKFRVEGNLSPPGLYELYDDLWDVGVLLKAKAPKMSLSPGSTVPKPKKFSDPTFCKLSIPATGENRAALAESLVPGFEAGDFEDLAVRHTIRVDELVIPPDMSGASPSAIRTAARRRGILSRELTVDGEETSSEFEFLA